ncbi:unnamed protein product [Rotaria socialis]|uniref:Uncharacterized protein n=1 Tax=Rotaria socialis TaxID=392032 RepID=A0A818I4B8_9BILA|nr:unnamed protein product [Rotaria socialis]
MSHSMDVSVPTPDVQAEAAPIPNWVHSIGRSHEGIAGALEHIANLFSRGVTPEITLNPLDEKFRVFQKKEIITDIDNDSYDREFIYVDYQCSDDLTNSLRQSSLRSDTATLLQNSRCIDILFHHRNSDTRYNYAYELTIAKFKYNYSFYYALIHKSRYHLPAQFKLNIILTESFIAAYEMAFIYMTDTHAVTPYTELHRCLNKEFIYRLYHDYITRSNEISHTTPHISHLRVPAVKHQPDIKQAVNERGPVTQGWN